MRHLRQIANSCKRNLSTLYQESLQRLKELNHQSSLTLKVSSCMAFQTIIKLGKFLKALEEDSKIYVFLPMATDVRDYLIVLVHPI